MKIEGSARSILTAERTALNFMQRMSGVASATRQYVDAVRGTHAQILDTRKTIPGWRYLDKLAVTHGGGLNHRMGLYDTPLLEASGGVTLKTVGPIAATGVDFISVGAITHSVKAMDLALDFVKRE